MIKILFLIHDLGSGGAEKVLVNLVNNMNHEIFDITVMTLFGGGVNEKYLSDRVRYQCVYEKTMPGNSHMMKLLSPKQLHQKYIKEHYDIEVSYLEGPSARIISGCQDKNTKLIAWIHSNIKDINSLSTSFRSKEEAIKCYKKFHNIVCVSQTMERDFRKLFSESINTCVLYNVVDSEEIVKSSRDEISEFDKRAFNIIAVGTLKEVKGYFRLISIIKKLVDQSYNVCLYIAGRGPLEDKLVEYIKDLRLVAHVKLLGYQSNPYKYVSKADLFVCSSFSEGFSTAATEALIVGTPVCTVEVSGMKEMLGENNEYGIVTNNGEEALYDGIKRMLDSPELLAHYRNQAKIRGKTFSTEKTVKAVESMFLGVVKS